MNCPSHSAKPFGRPSLKLTIGHAAILLSALLGAGQLGHAQNVPSNPAATGGQINPAGRNDLERVVVSGVRLEDNILPTARPVESTYGLSLNVQDTLGDRHRPQLQ